MNNRVECKTQQECDAALDAKDIPILIGDGWFKIGGKQYVEARESSHVVAWGSSHVVARESSHVVARGSSHVEAWGSSHVVARGSSHVEAWGSSHVEAWGSSHVVARESSHVVASKFVATHKLSRDARVNGGVVIVVEAPKTPIAWCEYYGARVENDRAILFKVVREDFRSQHGTSCAPGTTPEALDWDGGKAECGGGLHFSPHPLMAMSFDSEATKFVACPVALEDIFVHPNPQYPEKVKARRVCAPCYEVDRYGNPVTTKSVVS